MTAVVVLVVLYFLIFVAAVTIPKNNVTPISFLGLKVKNPILTGLAAFALVIFAWAAWKGFATFITVVLGSLVMFMVVYALLQMLMPIRFNDSADKRSDEKEEDSPILNDK